MKLVILIFLFLINDSKNQKEFEIAKVFQNRTFIVLYNPKPNDKEFIDQLKATIKNLSINKSVNLSDKKTTISFFTDKKYADYKPEINEQYQEWSKSYIAEFTNDDKKLVIYPLDLKKLKHVFLKY